MLSPGKLVTTLLLVPMLLGLLPACEEQDLTPEERIEALVDRSVEAVEQRQIGALKDLMAGDFEDQHRRDRKAALAVLQAYFLRHRAIHLLVRIEAIRITSAARAELTLIAAVAASRADSFRALADIRAKLWRFDFSLVSDQGQDWRFSGANWRPVTLEDVLN